MVEHKEIERRETGRGDSPGRSGTRRAAGADVREIEWQFDGADLGAVEGWLVEEAAGADLSVAFGAEEEITDVYYDTEDWRLYRAGYALRVRRKARGGSGRGRFEATIKSLASAGSPRDDGSLRRREISEPLRDGEFGSLLSKKRPGPVGVRLRPLVGLREARPLFEVRTRRKTFDLFEGRDAAENASAGGIVEDASGDIRPAGASGTHAGEVALDDTEILPGGDGGEPVRLARVEVEADAAAGEATEHLEGLAEAMKKELGLRPAGASKFETGLSAADLRPDEAPNVGPVDVDGNLTVGEVAFRILRRQFTVMRAHEPGTRLGEDPEELHDMRVATRRMRSAIKLFGDALPEEIRRLEGELKHFAGVLGDVRDLDVQIEQLEAWISESPEADREHLHKVVDALSDERRAARTRMLEALDSRRYEQFESSFAALLRNGPEEQDLEKGSIAGEPVLVAAPGLLSRPYRKWRKAAGRLNKASDSEEYHDLRKKGKRLRYALEFFTGVYGKEATGKLIRPLKEVQDGLGWHQDLIVAAELLEDLATGDRGAHRKLPARTAFAMGALAERNRREASDLRSLVPATKAYRKLEKGKAWEKLEKTMKRRSKKPAGPKAKAEGKKG